jgi:hypothetical protein
MAPALLANAIALALAIALLMAGVATAWRTANAARRLGGILCAHVAAMLALGVLGAPPIAAVTAVAIAFGYCAIGVAVTIRLQESYASAEAGEIDAADDQGEPAEPNA